MTRDKLVRWHDICRSKIDESSILGFAMGREDKIHLIIYLCVENDEDVFTTEEILIPTPVKSLRLAQPNEAAGPTDEYSENVGLVLTIEITEDFPEELGFQLGAQVELKLNDQNSSVPLHPGAFVKAPLTERNFQYVEGLILYNTPRDEVERVKLALNDILG